MVTSVQAAAAVAGVTTSATFRGRAPPAGIRRRSEKTDRNHAAPAKSIDLRLLRFIDLSNLLKHERTPKTGTRSKHIIGVKKIK